MRLESTFEQQQITYTGGEYQDEVFRYRLLQPPTIEAGKVYPLVLFLHGAGERGHDNVRQLEYLPKLMSEPEWRDTYPCFLIAPQCREERKWVDVPWGSLDSMRQGEATDQMRVVVQILDQVINENRIDPARVYLTGLSMGGYGCWDLAMRMPERFAAVAPICGGGDERNAAKLAKIPIWAWHGEADESVPVERSRRMIEAIRKAGGDPRYSELQGVGHNSWSPAYQDPHGLIPWMFEQRLNK